MTSPGPITPTEAMQVPEVAALIERLTRERDAAWAALRSICDDQSGEWHTVVNKAEAGLNPQPVMVATERPDLHELLAAARAQWDAMTPEQKEAILREQRESWVRGELGIGLDRQEAADRAARQNGGEK